MNKASENISSIPEEFGNSPGMNAESAEADASLGKPRITVLLVDDKQLIGKLVGRMLEPEEDIEFHYCQCAREAMKMANAISPTVILQDLVMPEIDGLYMVQYFRSKKKTRHIPLIVLSAEEDSTVKAKAFGLGANDYIVKLPDRIELLARIRYHSMAYISMLQRDAAHEALHESKKRVEQEREAAESAKQKIMASIRYAQMIQSSLLPKPENIRSFLPNSFFIWMPRDIVSGDFIFTDCVPNGFIIAVIDCTGHGVPGAFMTMIASSGLREIIREKDCHDPGQILKRLNATVKKTLQQDTEYALSDDGLDAAICLVRLEDTYYTSVTLSFARARLPLVCIQGDDVKVIKGDRKSIGYKRSDLNFNFTTHTLRMLGTMLPKNAKFNYDNPGGNEKYFHHAKHENTYITALPLRDKVNQWKASLIITFDEKPIRDIYQSVLKRNMKIILIIAACSAAILILSHLSSHESFSSDNRPSHVRLADYHDGY